jgi:hypothetical protein
MRDGWKMFWLLLLAGKGLFDILVWVVEKVTDWLVWNT